MNDSIQSIEFSDLLLAFLPVLVVIFIVWKWKAGFQHSVYAVFRMLVQLFLVGYLLTFIFNADSSWIVIGVLSIMLFSASWIALRTIRISKRKVYLKCFYAIALGGGTILILITQGVLNLEPWYSPSYIIPLAGMIFANAMNSISLAGERLSAELERNVEYEKARVIALQAALIPITNSLLAVGLVSLPGMMTGQILSGVSPFIAARYQIMVMCMMFGSAGISSALFLVLTKADFIKGIVEE
ncbi:MAG: ABC transporter permease [Cyclobacteriaceae bacterium]